jgi:hypothetical protein
MSDCFFLISSSAYITPPRESISLAGFSIFNFIYLISSVRFSSRFFAFLCRSREKASFQLSIQDLRPAFTFSVFKDKAPIWFEGSIEIILCRIPSKSFSFSSNSSSYGLLLLKILSASSDLLIHNQLYYSNEARNSFTLFFVP